MPNDAKNVDARAALRAGPAPDLPRRWFAERIGAGLTGLRALRPEGHPGADELGVCTAVWVQALWAGRAWDQAQDSPRIDAAYLRLAASITRWPQPVQFLRLLPDRAPAKALPAPEPTPDQRAQIRAQLQQIKNKLTQRPAPKKNRP